MIGDSTACENSNPIASEILHFSWYNFAFEAVNYKT